MSSAKLDLVAQARSVYRAMPEASLMTLKLTDKERDYLMILLEATHR